MGFHPSKKKELSKHISNNMITSFKRIAIEMSRKGFTDGQLEKFAVEPSGESLGLANDTFFQYNVANIIDEIKNRTTEEERFEALRQLAEEGKL